MRRRPYIHFYKGLTGVQNEPGKGWYSFAHPFVVFGVTFTGKSKIVRLGKWKWRYRTGKEKA